ncbi:hypothetical protein SeMB42_g00142 [Synchytrium endobioticum]|nr:hypothetical protein SeMB42_g00142 [Synchytrium endobioticum]
MTDFAKRPFLIILHYFILPFCQGAMYGLGETTARFYMRKWFGDMVTPPVSTSATVIKKNLLNNYSKRIPTLLSSPREDEMEWKHVVEAIFGHVDAPATSYSSRSTQQLHTKTTVGSLAIGAGNSWGRSVYIPSW